jgi:hypothetical protein
MQYRAPGRYRAGNSLHIAPVRVHVEKGTQILADADVVELPGFMTPWHVVKAPVFYRGLVQGDTLWVNTES